ncbi:30S ribosome-binding factor RbfA [Sphingobacteriales bacterium CHB3]|nr:30S ribosome-binding factor RbfA [Sphingobacteriales bacterium CHB3]
MSIRTDRVASLIKEEIGFIVTREYSSTEYGFITVTDVRMTPDLKIAKVFFSIFGTPEKQAKTMEMLDGQKQHIRGEVAHRVHLKFAPALQFYQDTTMDEVDKINRLINKIHSEEQKNGNDSQSKAES